ncbi:MAG: hypothetical protein K2I57_10525 [Muribaculaceae bacterium]|nr:hypothetical protein [Muribaculaceae bacterium]
MNTDIDKLISLTYEIEGLLLLLRDRSEESIAPHIRNLIADKGRDLAHLLCDTDTIPEHEIKAAEIPVPVPPTPQPIPQPAVATCADKPAEPGIVPPPAPTAVAEPEPEMQETTENEILIPKEEESTAASLETKIDEAQAEYAETDTEASEAEVTEKKAAPEIKASDEAGAKMLKLLTLNDRFRFRRELFGGSDTAMKAIMSVIATLPTLDAAMHYLTDEQGMDVESEEVCYFLEIIAPYYNQSR